MYPLTTVPELYGVYYLFIGLCAVKRSKGRAHFIEVFSVCLRSQSSDKNMWEEKSLRPLYMTLKSRLHFQEK